MKYFFAYLIVITTCSNLSFAQSFSFIDNKEQFISPTCAGYDDFYVHMKNEKNDSLLLQWIGILNQLDPCWESSYSICDNYNCYFGIPTSVSTMAKIGPGDTTFLKFSNAMMTHYAGTPTIKFLVWDMDLPTSIDTVTYHITICPDSTLCTEFSAVAPQNSFATLTIFPNPANEKIIVHSEEIQSVQIVNLIGQVIINEQFALTNEVTLNIALLPKGIYFIRVLTAEGWQTNKLIKS